MNPFSPDMAFCTQDNPGTVCWCGTGCNTSKCSSSGGCGGNSGGACGGSCGGSCCCCCSGGWYDDCFLLLGNVIDDTNIAPNCSCRCRCCICGGWCGAGCRCVRCGNICVDNCACGDCCCRQPTGRICIRKVDANNRTMGLACAEFQLLDSDCMPCALGCTDAEGRLCFNGLRNGTYHLCEINPPSGYQRNEDVTSITLSAFENQVFLEIANTPSSAATGSITVMARSASVMRATPLPGIKLGLFNASMGPMGTAVTDATGTAKFTGIPFATYTVDVVEQPVGIVTPGPVQVTVSADSPNPVIAMDFAPLVPTQMPAAPYVTVR